MKPVITCELKKMVGTSIRALTPGNLAQTVVEGYYALVNNTMDCIVVVLSDIEKSHFFKLKKIEDKEKSLEVVWHHCVVISPYPPEKEDCLSSFTRFIHYILDCS